MRTTRRAFIKAIGAGALAPRLLRAQSGRSVTDSVGRRVTLPPRVERVYAAGPPASILLFAMAPDKVLGWTSPFRPDERPFVPARYADLPTFGRLTGRGNTANVEVVLAARPDLVFDYGSTSPTFASLADRIQEQTGIPYLLIDGAFDRIPDAFRLLGGIIGVDEQGARWSRYAADTLEDIRARVARVPEARRPRVYYGRGPSGLQTGLSGSINMESIERAGARNVAAELGQGGLVQVTIEQVLRWSPEVIVTTDPNFFAGVWGDPSWRSLPAVRERRVHLAPGLPFGWIDSPPSVNRLVGLHWLGRILHPQAFTEPLRPIVRDFYARAYHQTPSESQLDALLATDKPPET
ncbi:MAG TPA: iron ABC transporter substrate-binding protein [Burkholderiales bacterium]|nr:iron ABC transporter substrate-binding protein [Burkholderiales bacterium]